MWSVGVADSFAAAHFIPGHPKCGRLHGHNYRVEVRLEGNGLNSMGFVVDFGAIKHSLHDVIGKMDHTLLNESVSADYLPPSAEKLAQYVHDQLVKALGSQAGMSVKVFETEGSWAEYRL
jgi:6-pyruvoyltetrahydropterin/6-carboxytetrahydropterin synthase